MKLARGIESANDTKLADEGEMLTTASLRRLSMAGIQSLVVCDKPVPGYDMGYDCAVCYQRLPFLFRNHKNDPFMTKLMTFLAEHFEERL